MNQITPFPTVDTSIHGTAGNDSAGFDTLIVNGARADYLVTLAASPIAMTPHVSSGLSGSLPLNKVAHVSISSAAFSDQLFDVDRLQFLDSNLAMDVTSGGHAGITARILGAVFGGDAVHNQAYAGIGLAMLDSGTSYQRLMDFALQAKLGAGYSTHDEVSLLLSNILHVVPSAAQVESYVNQVDLGRFTQVSLAVFGAESAENEANIDLVGLVAHGLAYI